jgi:tetratricopeptide (TPR) repeat protein
VHATPAAVAGGAGDRRAELRARLELANVRLLGDTGDHADELLLAAGDGIPVFEAAGDHRSLSRAWRLTAYVEGAVRSRYGASLAPAESALEHCVHAGWSTAAGVGERAAASAKGPTPAEEGIRRCRELLRNADLGGEANVLVQLSELEAMTGRFTEARKLLARSRTLYGELGQAALLHVNCGEQAGAIELLAGDARAAVTVLRESCEALEGIGERAYLATRAAQLAGALYANGEHDEAARWVTLAAASASPGDVPTQLMLRSVRTRLLAAEGSLADAEALAGEAVGLAATIDAPNQRAQVMLDLAAVLGLAGRKAEAKAALDEAVAVYEAKGNTVAARNARRAP